MYHEALGRHLRGTKTVISSSGDTSLGYQNLQVFRSSGSLLFRILETILSLISFQVLQRSRLSLRLFTRLFHSHILSSSFFFLLLKISKSPIIFSLHFNTLLYHIFLFFEIVKQRYLLQFII